jgi:glucose-1-phosphate cytidylyltransferase
VKVVLFCGGLGMRIRAASEAVPKPLVTVGPRPILWHIMRYYAHWGHDEFVLCLGYKGDTIEAYLNGEGREPGWRVTCVQTGLHASIGERLRSVRRHVDGDAAFLANYADGLSDFPLPALIDRLVAGDKVGAFLSVRPSLTCHFVEAGEDGTVTAITPPERARLRINGGYFVFRREIFDYMREGEDLVAEPFRRLTDARKLLAHSYDGFWKNMDTYKDKQALDELHAAGAAPWQVWTESDGRHA